MKQARPMPPAFASLVGGSGLLHVALRCGAVRGGRVCGSPVAAVKETYSWDDVGRRCWLPPTVTAYTPHRLDDSTGGGYGPDSAGKVTLTTYRELREAVGHRVNAMRQGWWVLRDSDTWHLDLMPSKLVVVCGSGRHPDRTLIRSTLRDLLAQAEDEGRTIRATV